MTESATTSEFALLPMEVALSGPPVAKTFLQRFNAWPVAALLVHSLLLIGAMHASPRRLGDAGGRDDAISVSLVSEADLRGDATIDDHAVGQPGGPPAEAQKPTQESQQQPEAQPTPPPQSETPPEQEKVQPQETAALSSESPPDSVAPDFKPALSPELAEEMQASPKPSETESKPAKSPEKTEKAEPAEKPAEAKPHIKPVETKAKPQKPTENKPSQNPSKNTKTANLDLAVPPAMFTAPAGSGGAGVERPAGITRSGENDRFARGVIRALQQTMPQLRDTRGRVRVRITLDRNGNLVSTQVMMPSQVAGLDQSVVFATRQTSFPLPPNNANSADLVFVVTYIYR